MVRPSPDEQDKFGNVPGKDDMRHLQLCGWSFGAGDVLKVECSDDTEKIVCVDDVSGDGRWRAWDLFAHASWDGAQGIVLVELNDKNIRMVRKVGHIKPEQRSEYIKFAIIYRQFRTWEKSLL